MDRTGGWIEVIKGLKQEPDSFFSEYKEELGFDKNLDLQIHKSSTDDIGLKHYMFRLEFEGIEIFDAFGTAHYDKDGELMHFECNFSSELPQSSKPVLSKNDAVSIALKSLPSSLLEFENKIKRNTEVELVYYKSDPNEDYTLTYKVHLYSEEMLTSITYFIDAIYGEVVTQQDNINHSYGSLESVYNGNGLTVSTHKPFLSRYYKLINKDFSTEIETRNNDINTTPSWLCCTPDDFNQCDEVKDRGNTWLLDDYVNAASTHWAVTEAYRVFKDEFGRTYGTFESSGGDIKVTNDYHRWKDENCYEEMYIQNAYLPLGNDDHIFAGNLYGSHNGFAGSLDAMGHEFTHGVIYRERSSQFITNNDAGAIAESLADIFGQVIEYYTTGVTDYCLAGDLDYRVQRDFINPNTYQRYSYNFDVDDYCDATLNWVPLNNYYPLERGDSNWDDVTHDKYINLMVSNRWFYLLAEGDAQLGVTGIGIEKAAKIAYHSMVYYLTTSTTYDTWRQSTISSAISYYSECSEEHKQVMNAWAAVGVGNPAPDPCNPSPPPLNVYISGPDYLSAGDCDIWYSNVSGGTGLYTYKWYVGGILKSTRPDFYECFNNPGYYQIELEVTSGTATEFDFMLVNVDFGGMMASVATNTIEINTYPNPSTDFINVKIIDSEEVLINPIEENELFIVLTNNQGASLHKEKYNGGELRINTSSLSNGSYNILLVSKNQVLKSAKVIVNH